MLILVFRITSLLSVQLFRKQQFIYMRKHDIRITKQISIFIAFWSICIACFSQSNDLEKLITNINQLSLPQTISTNKFLTNSTINLKNNDKSPDIAIGTLVKDAEIEQYINHIQQNGSWKDINYQDSKRSKWDPATHVDRIFLLTVAYKYSQSKYYNSPKLSATIHNAIYFWNNAKLHCPNWWYNEIGVPDVYSKACLLIKNELTKEEVLQINSVLDAAKFGRTGQNKVWLAANVLKRALLNNDSATVKEAYKQIASEVKTGLAEGIQPDNSFFQHGNQMQLLNYGLHYIGSLSQFARVFNGTRFAFSQTEVNILHNFFLDCLQWVDWKGCTDINAMGRQVFVDKQKYCSTAMLVAANNLMKTDTVKKGEYERYIIRNHANPGIINDLIGNRYFWRSDFGIQRTPTWYASVRMNSKRTIGFEMTNNENLKGIYSADGVMQLMLEGDEYFRIFPLWDWKKLPGLTAIEDGQPISYFHPEKPVNKSGFVGGVSDGTKGVLTLCIDKDSLHANKSYFFIDNKIVCMGSGITTDLNYPVYTTLNQTYLKGATYISTSDKKNNSEFSSEKDTAFNTCKWVYHNKIGYYLFSNQELNLSTKKQKGDWHDVASFYSNKLDSAQVFKLYISHGAKPQNAGYSYCLLPDVTLQKLHDFAANPSILIIKNSNECHAVANLDESCIEIVCIKPTKIQLKNIQLNCLSPGLFMLDYIDQNKIKLTVSDPSQSLSSIKLELNGNYTSLHGTYDKKRGKTLISIPLNTEDGERGKSNCIVITKKNN